MKIFYNRKTIKLLNAFNIKGVIIFKQYNKRLCLQNRNINRAEIH